MTQDKTTPMCRNQAFQAFPELLSHNSRYSPVKLIGYGAYSTVCSARKKSTGEEVAIKKIQDWKSNPNEVVRTIREVDIMRHFYACSETLQLQEIIVPDNDREPENLLLVTEKMDYDLDSLIKTKFISFSLRKNILHSIIRGLYILHQSNIVHRDIKPKNILIKDDRVVLADFGMARGIKKKHQRRLSMLHYTTSPYYRPPEGFLKCYQYGSEVDVWALGCMWIEMILGKQYFRITDKSVDPLFKIFGVCNVNRKSKDIIESLPIPEEQKTRGITLLKSYFKQKTHPNLYQLLENTNASIEEIELLQKIFQLDPSKRISSLELLKSPFFHCINSKPITTPGPYIASKDLSLPL